MHNRACYVPVARAPVIAQFYLNNFHESMAHCRGWNAAGRLRQRNPVPSIGLLIKDTSVQPRTRAFISPECYTASVRGTIVHATCITSSLKHNLHIVDAGYSRGLEANALSRLICTWSGEFAISTQGRERDLSFRGGEIFGCRFDAATDCE